jgi:hypothetical protein
VPWRNVTGPPPAAVNTRPAYWSTPVPSRRSGVARGAPFSSIEMTPPSALGPESREESPRTSVSRWMPEVGISDASVL